MNRIIEISKSLWLDVEDMHPDYDDGLFYIRDDTGGNVLIDRDEIPGLIEALGKVVPSAKEQG